MDEQKTYIDNLYGRRIDRPLRARQQQRLEEMLPRVAMPDPATGPIALSGLFPQAGEIWFEIGFGGGEHLAWQAERHPQVGLIGAESFVNGVAKMLRAIEEKALSNTRVHFGDARPLMQALPDGSLDRIFVLHPDPWPKRRHQKRRIISPWFFSEAARLLRANAQLRIASDIDDYIRWTLMNARAAKAFEWTAQAMRDWRERPDDWPQTRYGEKALREGRRPTYLVFRRL